MNVGTVVELYEGSESEEAFYAELEARLAELSPDESKTLADEWRAECASASRPASHADG